jgi:hypothetical protein
MPRKIMKLPMAMFLAAALIATAMPAEGSAGKTRPSGSGGGGSRASGATRGATGAAGATRGYGSGTASGRARWGYHRWRPYYHHRWYPGYAGLHYWSWGWPYLYGSWCGYPGACFPYRPVIVMRSTGDDPGAVETDVKPRKAAVFVDGSEVGQARDFNGNWDILFLEPGDRTLEFRYPGYMSLRVVVGIESGGYYRIKKRLTKGEGEDPRSMEPPPPEKEQPGRQRAAPADKAVVTQGLLRIEATPRDAAVYLDGEFLAGAGELARLHGALPVALGRHVVEVVRPGYVAESREIVVEEKGATKVVIDLVAEE